MHFPEDLRGQPLKRFGVNNASEEGVRPIWPDPVWALRSDAHADVFHLQIIFDAVVAAFAAEAGLFDAAKGGDLG